MNIMRLMSRSDAWSAAWKIEDYPNRVKFLVEWERETNSLFYGSEPRKEARLHYWFNEMRKAKEI